ncbi:MAG: amidase family protein, partial [Armatimonadota bacterium]
MRRNEGRPLIVDSAQGLRAAYASGAARPSEVIDTALGDIGQRDPALHAFLYVDADGARREAAAWDRRFAEAPDGAGLPPLAGVPVAVKDNMCTRGIPTTCGSRILEGWRPPYDATIVT